MGHSPDAARQRRAAGWRLRALGASGGLDRRHPVDVAEALKVVRWHLIETHPSIAHLPSEHPVSLEHPHVEPLRLEVHCDGDVRRSIDACQRRVEPGGLGDDAEHGGADNHRRYQQYAGKQLEQCSSLETPKRSARNHCPHGAYLSPLPCSTRPHRSSVLLSMAARMDRSIVSPIVPITRFPATITSDRKNS